MIRVPVKRLDPSVPLPAYARDGDAGLDLHAAHDVTLPPGGRALVGRECVHPELGRRDRPGGHGADVRPPEQDPLHIGSIATEPDIHQMRIRGSPD